MNVADQFGENNNCGFNLTNFKPKFIRDYFEDVLKDYERSFIGAFVQAALSEITPDDISNSALGRNVAVSEGG